MKAHLKTFLRWGSFALLLGIVVACGSGENNETDQNTSIEDTLSDKQKLIQKIGELEQLVYTGENGQLNPAYAQELLTLYKGFSDANPLEKETAEYLFKGGNVARGLGEFETAIAIFQRIRKNYPEYDRVMESLFLTAFIYENNLNQQGVAKGIYEEVIEEFPETRFAEDAKASIENMSLSEEELIKKFKAQNQDPG